ncbi:MAG TPA: DHH family phosphoesterase [bacterium]|nr:DHH family phosphoesterase [bacterium]
MVSSRYDELKPLLGPDQRGIIVIHADPDSLASAWALAQMFQRRGSRAEIAIFEPIKRIENRNMVKLLRIPLINFKDAKLAEYTRFCLVDAQPNQFPELSGTDWDIVIDHHPILPEYAYKFADIRPRMGATSSVITEYLPDAGVRISERLATALCYGIITDTDHFQRDMTHEDAMAFSHLFPSVNYILLQMIVQTEIQLKQLDYFDLMLHRLKVENRRAVIHIGPAESADIAVILSDFLVRVAGILFTAISCIVGDKLVIIFRSRSIKKDAGKIASTRFSDIGGAGGHRTAARAEIPMAQLPAEAKLYDPDAIEKFIKKRLSKPGKPAAAEGNGK